MNIDHPSIAPVLQKYNDILCDQEFIRMWESSDSSTADIQKFFDIPWWTVPWRKKGTLLHRAATHQKQEKVHWLKEVITDLETYKKVWPHEKVKRGLLETLLRCGGGANRVENIKPWLDMGIRWGAVEVMHEHGFYEWLDVPHGGASIPLNQLVMLRDFSQDLGLDPWGVGTKKDGLARVMFSFRMKDIQERIVECVDFLPKEIAIPNELLSELCQRGKHDLVMRVLRRAFKENVLKNLLEKEGAFWIACMLKHGRWKAACELAEIGCPWPEGSAHEAFAKHGVPFVASRKLGDKIIWIKEQPWFSLQTPKGKTSWIAAALSYNKTAVAFRLSRDLGLDPAEKNNKGEPVALTLTHSKSQYWFENKSVFGGSKSNETHKGWVVRLLSLGETISDEQWSDLVVRSVRAGRMDLASEFLASDRAVECDWEKTWGTRDMSWKKLSESEGFFFHESAIKKLKEMLEMRGLRETAGLWQSKGEAKKSRTAL